MLMGATFVVFTLSVGQMRSGSGLMLATAVLSASAFLSAAFAIMTVLPRVARVSSPVGPNDNILFFGVFSSMSEAAFIEHVLDALDSDENIFRLALRDIYQAGTLLQRRKYRFLGYAYRTFLIGMVLTAVAAVLELTTGPII
jgi:hypothetical protein